MKFNKITVKMFTNLSKTTLKTFKGGQWKPFYKLQSPFYIYFA